MSASGPKRTCDGALHMGWSGHVLCTGDLVVRFYARLKPLLLSNRLARARLDRSRKRFGFILLAVGQNLRRILPQAVIAENGAVRGRVVVTAHPVLY